jgi:hypothetical protein
MNPHDYFLWGYLRDRVYRTNQHTGQELQAEIEEITGDILPDTGDKLVVSLQRVYVAQGTHIEHLFT